MKSWKLRRSTCTSHKKSEANMPHWRSGYWHGKVEQLTEIFLPYATLSATNICSSELT